MKFNRTVKVYSVKDYFALPKKDREWHGFYKVPRGLPLELLSSKKDKEEGWETFSNRIRKEYPIQGFIREWLLTYDNPIYRWFGRRRRKLREIRYNTERFFKPNNPRFRKAYRRWEYKDTSQVIVDANFALILDFWYEEVVDGVVDWQATTEHKDFYNWLKSAVEYIEVYRPRHQYVLDKSYDLKDNYKTVHMYEDLIHNADTEILKKMVEYRSFFWT